MTQRRVNLRDIAEAAGVSMQTASRVVRGVDNVAETTRLRVVEAVKQLNYQPNLAARYLSTQRTGSVNVIVAAPLQHGHAATFVAIVHGLANLGLYASSSIVSSERSSELSVMDLVPHGSDGVIVMGGDSQPKPWLETLSKRIPTVYVGGAEELPPDVSTLTFDQEGGARLATRRLIDAGARSLAHVCGPHDWVDATIRRRIFEEVCEAAGVPYSIVPAESWNASRAVEVLADSCPDADGFFAANDQLALGTLTALQRRGKKVPEQVKLVGFDDAAGSDSLNPPLTTIRQDFVRLGESAVGRLQEVLNGGEHRQTTIDIDLVERESA